MRKIISAVITVLTFFQINSCNYLDIQVEYDDLMPYDSVFHSTINLQRYLWSIPTAFPDPGQILGDPYTPGVMATDEALTKFDMGQYSGMRFVTGKITPSDLAHFNNWSSMYKVIRRVNILLNRMDEAVDLTPIDRIEITGYARFIRAYAYYLLFINFGPLILMGDEVMNNNEEEAYYGKTYRATFDETVDYICDELEASAEMLPPKVIISNFGRPERGSAWGLIARLRLIQASPVYNGGDAARLYFGNWRRKIDNVNYVSQTYDERKWAVAAAACERIIETGLYRLHTVPADGLTQPLPANVPTAAFPDGAGGIDCFKSYSEMFNGETIAQTNPELLWAQYSGHIRDKTRESFPKTLLGGWNGMGITQKVVDAYRMADGRKINESSNEYPYLPEQMYNEGSKTFSGYFLNNNISGMFANRELRFYASVGFSKRFWTCLSTTESGKKNLTITYHAGGNADKADAGGNNIDYQSTGHTIVKYVHPDDAWTGNNSRRMEKAFPTVRYAEILLSYAEAMNNLTRTHTVNLTTSYNEKSDFTVSRDEKKMSAAFNQVRFRAGLPGLSASELESKDQMQAVLEQERMVEFLFENRRYFDVRRWGIYEQTESEPIRGMNILAPEPEFYTPVVVNEDITRNRIVDRKLMFVPIPKWERQKVKNLDQNPGWNDGLD